MRIAVSDYDGTIYQDRALIGDVVGAVTKWRADGNVFVIATGRDYWMTIPEVTRWSIPVDCLICTNGAGIHNSDGTLLQRTDIPDEIIPPLLRHPAALASMHFQLSSSVEPLRVFLRENSWFPRTTIKFVTVDYEKALTLTGLGQISLAYEGEEECIGWEKTLRQDFGDTIEPHRNKTTIDINVRGIDKASGIESLLRLRGWEENDVSVIGDGGNDIGMIQRFGGYTVPGAQEETLVAAKKVFASVAEMLATV